MKLQHLFLFILMIVIAPFAEMVAQANVPGIRIIKLVCHETSENGDDEIYFKSSNGSDFDDASSIAIANGETIPINYDIPISNDGTAGFEIWEDDDPGDDQIGVFLYHTNPPIPGMFSTGTGSGSKHLTGDKSSYTLYYKYLSDINNDPINKIKPVNPHFLPGDDMSSLDDPYPWIKEYTKDWMSKLPPTMKLKDVSLPGTHNSASRFGGVGPECQSWTIMEQLEAGIRYFDIRVRCNNNELYIYHGDFYQYQAFDGVIEGHNYPSIYSEFVNFLAKHPEETIILDINSKGVPTEDNKFFNSDQYCNWWDDVFRDDYYNSNALFYTGGKDPVLNDVRGKIFCEFDMKDESQVIEDHWKVWFGVSGTFNHEEQSLALPDKKTRVRGVIFQAMMEEVNKGITGGRAMWYLNFLNGAQGMTPINCADHVNEYIYQFLNPNTSIPGKAKLGILIMDFPGEHLIYRIIQSNFDLNG